ncbi:GHKL domain-containing protein [Lactiplantibacillus plantarum]|uniref:GHKL domain-containing protein n=1 Tax=Lactiplantibacillus plantarum TaxID=1590 RepID=UPI00288B641D|nr:GHKL domain-containing protein [Lactiplantibacillus plantarum]
MTLPKEKLLPLWQLKKAGCSTKGDNRGLGLANLQEIIDKYPRVILETTYTNVVFLQKIIIGED